MEESRGPILIVDDEESLRNVLYRKLKAEGYDCEVATDGKDALRKSSMKSFALVLMDIKMPGMSGMEVLPKLIAEHPDTGIVMLTAVVDTGTAVEAMKQGAYDYVTKPFDTDDLSLRVKRALERRRLVLENREYQRSLEQRVEQQVGQIRQYYQEALLALSREQIALQALETARKIQKGGGFPIEEVTTEPAGSSSAVKEMSELFGAALDLPSAGNRAIPVSTEAGKEESKHQPTLSQDAGEANEALALYEGTVEIAMPPPISLYQMLQLHERLRPIPNVRVLNLGGSVEKGITIRLLLEAPTPLVKLLKGMPEVEKAIDESESKDKSVPSRQGDTMLVKRIIVSLSKRSSGGGNHSAAGQ